MAFIERRSAEHNSLLYPKYVDAHCATPFTVLTPGNIIRFPVATKISAADYAKYDFFIRAGKIVGGIMDGLPIDRKCPAKVKVIPGEFKSDKALSRDAENAQTLGGCTKSWNDIRWQGKIYSKARVRTGPRRNSVTRNKRKSAKPADESPAQVITDVEIDSLARLANGFDKLALSKLIQALKPTVDAIARRYAKANEQLFEGLVHEGKYSGSSEIVYALGKFDPAQRVPFRMFAQRSIRWAMTAYLRRLNAENKKYISLETEVYDDGTTAKDLLKDGNAYGEDAIAEREALEKKSELLAALNSLDDRERHIIERRIGLNGADATFTELAIDLGISAERCRQIACRAEAKMRAKFQEQISNSGATE